MTSDLESLRNGRLAGLPLTCPPGREPGIMDAEEWRDWSAQPTTPDQLRIENYLEMFDLRGKRLLHVGSGNSQLAVRFHRRTGEIVGTTVVPQERDLGKAMGLPNYRVLLHNKYVADGAPEGPFDFIVDNNPTTFGCCLTHLQTMLRFYAGVLAEGGQVVTDKVGLGWVSAGEGQNPRWGFDFGDLAAVAPLAGLTAWRHDEHIYVLARERPASPGLSSRIIGLLRRVRHRLGRS